MRAIAFEGIGMPLAVTERPDPTPAADQVVLKVHSCGICGTDLHRSEAGLFCFAHGTVPGHEFAGEVVALGRDCTTLRIGDRVTALPYMGCGHCGPCIQGAPNFCSATRNVGGDQPGAFAEYVAVGGRWCVPLPDELTMDDGALIEPLAVGLHGVRRAGIGPDSRVLIIGAGPIGLAAAWWARRCGASRIAVTASSDRRAEMALAMGAHVFAAPVEGEPLSVTVDRALGGAPDVVMECVGLPGMIDKAISCVRTRGVVAVLGVCTHPDSFLSILGMAKEVDIRFSQVYDHREFELSVEAMAGGDFRPRLMVTDRVGLDDAPAAFEALRRRTHQCKVMVTPWS